MTTGNYNVTLDSYNYSRKAWSGADTPKGQPYRENSYSVTINRHRATPGETWETRYPNVTQTPSGGHAYDIIFNGDGPWPNLPEWNWQPNIELEALSKLASTIRDHSFNAGIFAAELHQSLETVVLSCRHFLTALVKLKRRDLPGAVRSFARVAGVTNSVHGMKLRAQYARRVGGRANLAISKATRGNRVFRKYTPAEIAQAREMLHLGDVSGALLALQYGWKPLISDIWEMSRAYEFAMDSLRGQGYIRKAHKTYHWTAPRVWQNSTSGAWLYSPQPGNRAFGPSSWTLTVRYRVRIAEQLSLQDSLQLRNPETIVWEIIPFSFVADWFIPIGNYLDARATFSNLKLQEVTVTKLRKREVSVTNWTAGDPNQGVNGWSLRGLSRHGLDLEMSRTILNPVALSVPKPAFKGWSNAFSPTHLANGAALIHQLTRQIRHS